MKRLVILLSMLVLISGCSPINEEPIVEYISPSGDGTLTTSQATEILQKAHASALDMFVEIFYQEFMEEIIPAPYEPEKYNIGEYWSMQGQRILYSFYENGVHHDYGYHLWEIFGFYEGQIQGAELPKLYTINAVSKVLSVVVIDSFDEVETLYVWENWVFTEKDSKWRVEQMYQGHPQQLIDTVEPEPYI